MTLEEFSNEFDILVSSYRRFKDFDNKEILDSIEFNEYEKSVYLTKAQEELVIELYNGKNPYVDSFESTEELRRYLDGLVKTKIYWNPEDSEEPSDDEGEYIISDLYPLTKDSKFVKLPDDLSFITLEQVQFSDEKLGCYNNSTADVYPVTQDEYNRIIRNPFRGPTKRRVLRIDTGNNIVELASKFNIKTYLIKYLSKPSPIILEDLPNDLSIRGVSEKTPCELNENLHNTILKRAVQLALQSKTINTKDNDGN